MINGVVIKTFNIRQNINNSLAFHTHSEYLKDKLVMAYIKMVGTLPAWHRSVSVPQ